MQPVFETLLDLPCDHECLANIRKDSSVAIKDHPCFEELYQPLLEELGKSGSRGEVAGALLGKSGGKKHK